MMSSICVCFVSYFIFLFLRHLIIDFHQSSLFIKAFNIIKLPLNLSLVETHILLLCILKYLYHCDFFFATCRSTLLNLHMWLFSSVISLWSVIILYRFKIFKCFVICLRAVMWPTWVNVHMLERPSLHFFECSALHISTSVSSAFNCNFSYLHYSYCFWSAGFITYWKCVKTTQTWLWLCYAF